MQRRRRLAACGRPARWSGGAAPLLRIAVLVLLVAGPASVRAMPDPSPPDVWDRWTVHDPTSTAVIDHRAWDRFLSAYVVEGQDGINRVAYRWVTEADAATLDLYLAQLEQTPISRFGPDEQRAFWINLYNAATVRLVLRNYPVESILDIDLPDGFFDGLFGDGPWGRKLLTVEGAELSLDDIEHRILRPIWSDPRLHYALNCAGVSCPNLQRQAFTGANVDALLERGATAYVNHPRGVTFDDDGDLVVSSLYLWYEDDFGGDEVSIISHLRRYAGAELSRALIGRTEIDDDRYDWALNDIR